MRFNGPEQVGTCKIYDPSGSKGSIEIGNELGRGADVLVNLVAYDNVHTLRGEFYIEPVEMTYLELQIIMAFA